MLHDDPLTDVVRYLEPRPGPDPGRGPAVPGGDGPSSYYADRRTEPGRWLGHGAAESGLHGAVGADDFARVLAGRDPRTGARLITARGSAGRRPTPDDPDFRALFRRRNDAESINRAIEDTLWLGRAHSVGHRRQLLNLLGYALMVNSLAVARHSRAKQLAA